ncbi:unnamed protein product [Lactuca virosa]|uniref:Uncharacterized protein n=1 Tax=Lactuca virosa TaxID=75947 RepID=A0AAU9P1Z0_9ASTR|nr:unnamed protein product [Lactuca virosa]
MLVVNDDVWKATVCSLVIRFIGGAYEKSSIPLALSTIGGVVLLETVVSCWLCDEAFCVDAVAEDIDPSMTGLHSWLIVAVVIAEPPCCGASPATVVGF